MATRTAFTLGEEELAYEHQDNSGAWSLEIDYAKIPGKRRSVFQRNNWLRNVGFIWVALGAIQIGLAVAGGGASLGAAFWLFIGLGCLAFYRLTWSAYTVIDTEEGAICVIQDKQHDIILGAIDERRREKLLAWFNAIDFQGNDVREMQTIDWLVKQGVMEKDKAQARRAEIENRNRLLSISTENKNKSDDAER
jgi:hypothetical protein